MTIVATYNMQGGGNWANIGPMIGSGSRIDPIGGGQEVWQDVDVFCLQECGRPPRPLGAPVNGIATGNYNGFDFTYAEWGALNVRCSLAIATKLTVVSRALVSTRDRLRPFLAVTATDPTLHRNVVFLSAHLPSGNHGHSASVAHDTIRASFGAIGDFVLAGDFNCTPAELMNPPGGRSWSAGHLGPAIPSPTHSGAATQMSGNNLDYAISSLPLECIGTRGMSSDHIAVYFQY